MFFHLKIRLRALSARRFFKRCYRFIFFLFLIACSRQNSLRSTYLWKEAIASKFPRFHRTQKSSKSATSKQQQQQAKSNITTDICTFSQERALGKITPFLRYVHFFATNKRTLTPEQARSKITPFLRNVRFLADKFSDECALFRRNTQ